jgi:hypothetical protein
MGIYLMDKEMDPYMSVANRVRELFSSMSEINGTDDNGQPIWVVLDIDGTLLSDRNVIHLYKNKSDVFQYQYRAIFVGIAPMIDLYKWLWARKVKIALLTGRGEAVRAATIRNLHKVGVLGWDELIMKPSGRRIDTETFKIASRKSIEDRHNEGKPCIVANIGDQDSDLNGGYSEYIFKLPSSY